MATFATLQGMRIAPRDPSNPRYALSNFSTFRSTNPFEMTGVALPLDKTQAAKPEARPPPAMDGDEWGTHRPNVTEFRRSMSSRLQQRADMMEAEEEQRGDTGRSRRLTDSERAEVKRQQAMAAEIDRLRDTIQQLQREPLRESLDDGFFDRLQQLKREHERNLRAVERAYAESRPERAPGAAAAARRRPSTSRRAAGSGAAPQSRSGPRPHTARARPGRAPSRGHRSRARGDSDTSQESDSGSDRGDDGGRSARGRSRGPTRGEDVAASDDGGDDGGDDDALWGRGPGAGDEGAAPDPLMGDAEEQDERSWAQRVRDEVLADAPPRASSPTGAGGMRRRRQGGSRRASAAASSTGGRSLSRQSTELAPFVGMERAELELEEKRRKLEARKRAAAEEEARRLRESRPRARPIPQSTLENRYEVMVAAQQARSEEIRASAKQRIRESMRPFQMDERARALRAKHGAARREREQRRRERAAQRERGRGLGVTSGASGDGEHAQFRASGIPQAVLRAAARGRDGTADEEAERARRERVQAAMAARLAEAKLPPRMEMWERERAAMAQSGRGASTGARRNAWEARNAQPKVNTRVPDFEKIQQRWAAKLRRSKQTSRRTRVQAFSFDQGDSERARAEAERAERRAARAERRAQEEEAAEAMLRASQPRPAPLPHEPHGNTAAKLRLSVTQRLLQERRAEEEAEKKAAEARAAREREAVAWLARKMRGEETDRSRPTLMERFSTDVARERARHSGAKRVAQAAYGTTDPGRMQRRSVADDGLLTEDDVAVLGALAGTEGVGTSLPRQKRPSSRAEGRARGREGGDEEDEDERKDEEKDEDGAEMSDSYSSA